MCELIRGRKSCEFMSCELIRFMSCELIRFMSCELIRFVSCFIKE